MMPLIEGTARRIGEFSFCRDWRGDPFTNSANFFRGEPHIRLPDLVICLDTWAPLRPGGSTIVRDSAKMLIPTVAVVDTNSDPRLVTYPVPGNDDSPVSVRLFCACFAAAVEAGKSRARYDNSILTGQNGDQTDVKAGQHKGGFGDTGSEWPDEIAARELGRAQPVVPEISTDDWLPEEDTGLEDLKIVTPADSEQPNLADRSSKSVEKLDNS
ncbi:unnamed protein product [Protopolystoma xenopodis]|uniref:Ribosomal protein S2 n=1 Tax=Protopolystoma xenopodis TaxID=117903 RepID=A0A448X3A2_9PLAT|nr:unnamed protein product [Protopolystoma xenopodis]